MPIISLKHKCLSIILIWVIFFSKVVVVSKKKLKKKLFFVCFGFTFLNWEKYTNRHGIGKKGGYFRLKMRAEIQSLKKIRKCPVNWPAFHSRFLCSWLALNALANLCDSCRQSTRRKRWLELRNWYMPWSSFCWAGSKSGGWPSP